MQINTLVTHKKLTSLGIGCVSKLFSKTVNVNFGTEDTVKCNPDQLIEIDTSKCKTESINRYRGRIMMSKDDEFFNYCIVGNELRHFVGIGWITHRVITLDDLKKYPRIV